jgi:glycosyltransferase involved in cell wall biosynthesis
LSYKIGLDARPLSTRVSGVGRLISETLKYFPDKKNYKFYLFSHLPIHESHLKILEQPNITFIQGKGILSKKGATYFNIYLPFEIKKYKLDLFWGSQQVIPPFFLNLPVVLTYCDLVLYKFPESMRFLARIQQMLVQKNSVNKAKFILNISKQTRDDLVEKFSYPTEKTGIAYPGVSLKEIENFLKSKKPNQIPQEYILSVSTIEPRKNYSFLLKVWKEFRKINSSYKWVIIGKKGWESGEFFRELESEMKNGDILILEKINDEELHHFYKNSSLFLFASHYEGFGIPLLEALAHKKKSLVSAIPTFREIGGGEISYLEAEDEKLWAEKMNEILKSEKKPEIDLDFFSWENSSKITKKYFDRVLKNDRNL